MSTRRKQSGSTSGLVFFELRRTKSMKRGVNVKSGYLSSCPASNGVHDVTVNLMGSFLRQLSSVSTVENPIVRQECRITNTGTFQRSKACLGVMNESNCKLSMLFGFSACLEDMRLFCHGHIQCDHWLDVISNKFVQKGAMNEHVLRFRLLHESVHSCICMSLQMWPNQPSATLPNPPCHRHSMEASFELD
jgi:hypothetical protein